MYSDVLDVKKIVKESLKWKVLIKDIKLKPNYSLIITNDIKFTQYINFIRLNIYPDGGISRFRVFGKLKK